MPRITYPSPGNRKVPWDFSAFIDRLPAFGIGVIKTIVAGQDVHGGDWVARTL